MRRAKIKRDRGESNLTSVFSFVIKSAVLTVNHLKPLEK